MLRMALTRAMESMKAAEHCLGGALVNSAGNRAYYVMFRAAQVALEAAGLLRSAWIHKSLHASFNKGLIQRRKFYPRNLREY
jgi:uncharacterized protein (UPF0332 family)